MNDNDIEINLDNENENIDVDREDSIYTNISEEEMNEIKSRIQANENDIVILKAESGNKVLLSIDSNYVMTLQLLNKNNEVLSTGTIDLPIESMIVNASYSNGILTLTLQNGQTLNVDISDIVSGLVSETTFNNAIGQLQGSITALQGRMTQAETAIQGKVDKVTGKGLSTEDYTTAEKNKLANLENYDDTEVKADIQENTDDIEALTNKHNTEVAELQSQIEDLQAENQALEDQIPTDNATGSDITLSDSARYKFKKIVPGGKSEQETFTGKNLLNVNETWSVTRRSTKTVNLPAGTYHVTCKKVTKGGANNPALVGMGDWFYLTDNLDKTVTLSNDVTSIQVFSNGYDYDGSTGITSIIEQLMISTEGGAYEPYTNGPAPNPDYECPIKNVTGDVNIFNEEQLSNSSLYQSSGNYFAYIEMPSNFKSKFYASMFLKGLEQNLVAGFSDVNNNVSTRILNNAQLNNNVIYDFTNAEHVYFVIGNTNKINVQRDIPLIFDNYNIKVSKEKITSYTSYNCGSVEVKVQNKNLFDESTVSFITGILDDNGNATGSASSHYTENFYEVKPNTQYVLSGTLSTGNSNSRLYFYDKGKEWISRTAGFLGNQYKFTTPNDCYFIKIQVAISIELNNNDVILEEGSTATDYIPHEEQTATFPLEEGQILHASDTIEDKIVQRRKTIVFDGTENWNLFFSTEGIFTRSLSNVAVNSSSTKNVICNYFIGTNRNYIRNNLATADNLISCFGAELTIANKSITTAADFKAWVAEKYANGTPLTVEYELAEPIKTEFTEAQVTAKAQIDKLYSYKGTTHITSEAALDVIYRKDLETMFDKMEELDARLSLLES